MTPSEGLKAINGTHLYYKTIGAGKPIFVLHGRSGSHRYFLPHLAPLADDYHVVFYDQRGTGLSDGQLDLMAITMDQFVEDLEALRRAFGFEQIALLSHSWGAEIALAYAFKYPAHLDHLILVDPLPVTNTFLVEQDHTIKQRVAHLSPEAQHMLQTTCQGSSTTLRADVRTACLNLDAALRFYDPAKALTMDATTDKNTERNAATVQSLLTASFNRMQPEIDAQLKTLRVPTLIVHGDFDPIPISSSEYIHHLVVASQFVIIKESGHFPFVEQPERFFAAI
ncbi:MAG: alpha/beta fold hydrolase [Herpetosiphon sp.]